MSDSLWIITEQAIADYSNAVENLEPMYFNKDNALKAGFENIIAPVSFLGQYQMSLDPKMKVPKGGVHTKQKMKFLNPIKAGDYIYSTVETVEELDHKGRNIIKYITTFKNQDNKIVCISEMTNLLPKK